MRDSKNRRAERTIIRMCGKYREIKEGEKEGGAQQNRETEIERINNL